MIYIQRKIHFIVFIVILIIITLFSIFIFQHRIKVHKNKYQYQINNIELSQKYNVQLAKYKKVTPFNIIEFTLFTDAKPKSKKKIVKIKLEKEYYAPDILVYYSSKKLTLENLNKQLKKSVILGSLYGKGEYLFVLPKKLNKKAIYLTFYSQPSKQIIDTVEYIYDK